jgi:hypothetical protein
MRRTIRTQATAFGATDAEVLQIIVHFDKEAAGFDSRDGATPRALAVLCKAGALLRTEAAADSLAHALNDIVAAVASGKAR